MVAPFCHLPCYVVWNVYWKESKAAVLAEHEKSPLKLPEEAQEKLLLRATNGLALFNTSQWISAKWGRVISKANLSTYMQSFSKDVREIFEYFNFINLQAYSMMPTFV